MHLPGLETATALFKINIHNNSGFIWTRKRSYSNFETGGAGAACIATCPRERHHGSALGLQMGMEGRAAWGWGTLFL